MTIRIVIVLIVAAMTQRLVWATFVRTVIGTRIRSGRKSSGADPVWRFNRIVSFALTCMNMDNASAIAFALKTMNLEAIP